MIKLKAPDGTKMSLLAEFCGERHPDGWKVYVTGNPGNWWWAEFASRDDEDDIGVKVLVPEGTKAKVDGKRVR
jgi:hypothetical protein